MNRNLLRSLSLLALLAGCGDPERPLLSPYELLGRTPEELIERLGTPQMHIEETPTRIGFLRWNDVDGVRALVVYSDTTTTYVTYQFPDSGPFQEERAFGQLGLQRPSTAALPMKGSQARVWKPAGDFARISVNPFTRLISVGPSPDWAKRGIRSGDDLDPLEMLHEVLPQEQP